MDKVWGCEEISPFSDFVFYLFCFSFSDFVFYLFCFFFSNFVFFCLFLLKKRGFPLSIKHIDIGFWDLIY